MGHTGARKSWGHQRSWDAPAPAWFFPGLTGIQPKFPVRNLALAPEETMSETPSNRVVQRNFQT